MTPFQSGCHCYAKACISIHVRLNSKCFMLLMEYFCRVFCHFILLPEVAVHVVFLGRFSNRHIFFFCVNIFPYRYFQKVHTQFWNWAHFFFVSSCGRSQFSKWSLSWMCARADHKRQPNQQNKHPNPNECNNKIGISAFASQFYFFFFFLYSFVRPVVVLVFFLTCSIIQFCFGFNLTLTFVSSVTEASC